MRRVWWLVLMVACERSKPAQPSAAHTASDRRTGAATHEVSLSARTDTLCDRWFPSPSEDDLEYPRCEISALPGRVALPWYSPQQLAIVTSRTLHHGHLYNESKSFFAITGLVRSDALFLVELYTGEHESDGTTIQEMDSISVDASTQQLVGDATPELVLTIDVTPGEIGGSSEAAELPTREPTTLIVACRSDRTCTQPLEESAWKTAPRVWRPVIAVDDYTP